MNRGQITPQPQIGVSYLDPATPAPPAPPFQPPFGSTLPPLFLAAGARVLAYFPSDIRLPTQTWSTATLAAAT